MISAAENSKQESSLFRWLRANARKVYWAGTQPIPGGISFENFEFQERFYPGQEFIYGITKGVPRFSDSPR